MRRNNVTRCLSSGKVERQRESICVHEHAMIFYDVHICHFVVSRFLGGHFPQHQCLLWNSANNMIRSGFKRCVEWHQMPCIYWLNHLFNSDYYNDNRLRFQRKSIIRFTFNAWMLEPYRKIPNQIIYSHIGITDKEVTRYSFNCRTHLFPSFYRFFEKRLLLLLLPNIKL